MTYWIDIASIVFVCVTMNHLGLISAIESVIHRKLWIVDCPKCASFWCVLSYLFVEHHDMVTSLAVSFLASYTAIWLELLEGFIDTLYMKLYEKIYPNTTDDTASSIRNEGSTTSSVSEL